MLKMMRGLLGLSRKTVEVQCPCCAQPMNLVRFNKADVDVCAQGHGIWFDLGEMRWIAESDTAEVIDACFDGTHTDHAGEALARHYGFQPRACRPYRPKTKGKVERPFSYIRLNLNRGAGAHQPACIALRDALPGATQRLAGEVLA